MLFQQGEKLGWFLRSKITYTYVKTKTAWIKGILVGPEALTVPGFHGRLLGYKKCE